MSDCADWRMNGEVLVGELDSLESASAGEGQARAWSILSNPDLYGEMTVHTTVIKWLFYHLGAATVEEEFWRRWTEMSLQGLVNFSSGAHMGIPELSLMYLRLIRSWAGPAEVRQLMWVGVASSDSRATIRKELLEAAGVIPAHPEKAKERRFRSIVDRGCREWEG